MNSSGNTKIPIINMINKGSYGCIYHPNIRCPNTKDEQEDKYISKISMANSLFAKELAIGKMIQNIHNYEAYYAPILENCEISVATFSNDQCTMIQENKDDVGVKFVSSKIRYVGDTEIFPHLLRKPMIHRSMDEIMHMFIFLLHSIHILNTTDKGIIHYDIKSNNIMIDDKLRNPILIDFGLSFTADMLENPADWPTIFYGYVKTSEEKMPYWWCIDIVLLSYIVQIILEKDYTKASRICTTEEVEKMCGIIDSYYTDDMIFSDNERRNKSKEISKNTIRGYLDAKMSWETIIRTMNANYPYWDLFSIGITFLMSLYRHKVGRMNEYDAAAADDHDEVAGVSESEWMRQRMKSPAMDVEFLYILKNIVYSPLGKLEDRPTPQKILQDLMKSSLGS